MSTTMMQRQRCHPQQQRHLLLFVVVSVVTFAVLIPSVVVERLRIGDDRIPVVRGGLPITAAFQSVSVSSSLTLYQNQRPQPQQQDRPSSHRKSKRLIVLRQQYFQNDNQNDSHYNIDDDTVFSSLLSSSSSASSVAVATRFRLPPQHGGNESAAIIAAAAAAAASTTTKTAVEVTEKVSQRQKEEVEVGVITAIVKNDVIESDSSNGSTSTTTNAKMKRSVPVVSSASSTIVVVGVTTVLNCIALISGTTIGAGILALPTVTYTSGFVASTIALLMGYIVMTMSGLLIAELTIRIGNGGGGGNDTIATLQLPTIADLDPENTNNNNYEQGLGHDQQPSTTTSSPSSSLGLLDLYNQGMIQIQQQQQHSSSSLSDQQQQQLMVVQCGSTIAYFFLHYAMMVAYIAQGGTNLISMFPNYLHNTINVDSSSDTIGPIVFTAIIAISIYTIPKRIMSILNNVFVLGVFVSMGSILLVGTSTIDMNTLLQLQPSYQNPINILSSLPIIFLAFVYHNIVPIIVKELQYDTQLVQVAIIVGTSLPLVLFVAWNAIVLGNIDPTVVLSLNSNGANNFDPIAVLMSTNTNNGGSGLLGTSISVFSTLAVITSLIGFTYGLNEAWNDLLSMTDRTTEASISDSDTIDRSINNEIVPSPQFVSSLLHQKLLIYLLIFVPPLLIALYNPNIFVSALEYGGTFGVTTLFLLLPSYIVWNLRYTTGSARNNTFTSKNESSPAATTTTTATTTLVPGGKLPMIVLWMTAIGLMIDQISDKLGTNFISST